MDRNTRSKRGKWFLVGAALLVASAALPTVASAAYTNNEVGLSVVSNDMLGNIVQLMAMLAGPGTPVF